MHPVLVQDLARDRHLLLRERSDTRVRVAATPRAGLTTLLLRSSVRRAERRAVALERESRRLSLVLADVEQRAHAARARLAVPA